MFSSKTPINNIHKKFSRSPSPPENKQQRLIESPAVRSSTIKKDKLYIEIRSRVIPRIQSYSEI